MSPSLTFFVGDGDMINLRHNLLHYLYWQWGLIVELHDKTNTFTDSRLYQLLNGKPPIRHVYSLWTWPTAEAKYNRDDKILANFFNSTEFTSRVDQRVTTRRGKEHQGYHFTVNFTSLHSHRCQWVSELKCLDLMSSKEGINYRMTSPHKWLCYIIFKWRHCVRSRQLCFNFIYFVMNRSSDVCWCKFPISPSCIIICWYRRQSLCKRPCI